MIKKTLTVLLIEDNPEYAELVQRWLTGKDDTSFVLNWTDSLRAGLNRLAAGGIDVILLDLGLPDSNGLETFAVVRAQAPRVPLILLSGGDSEALALGMVQAGAQDYLVKTTCNSDLLIKALRYAILRTSGHAGTAGSDSSTEHATVIGVLGAKGGVGTTTFACSLAVEMRRLTGQGTLLADLNMSGGLVSFLTNAESEYSISDALSNMHRLDASFWEGIVSQGAHGLDIVGSPSLLNYSEDDTDKLGHLITLIRTFYRWIVLDVGRLTGSSMGILDRVNELFLVTTSTIPALYQSKRVIDTLVKGGIKRQCLRLIVNQVPNTREFHPNELNQTFGIPLYAKLRDASQELHDACTNGKLAPENGIFRAQISSLARKLAGLPEEKPKRGVSQLFSFSEKFKRAESSATEIVGPPGR